MNEEENINEEIGKGFNLNKKKNSQINPGPDKINRNKK